MEEGRVRGVGGVAAEHAARADDPDRRVLRFHHPDLNGRGVRAEEQVHSGHVDRVHLFARGMAGGDVERFEVVPRSLDLGARGDREPHPPEDLEQLVGDDRERMAGSLAAPAARQRDIQSLVRQPARQLAAGQLRFAPGDRPLEGALHVVDELARLRPRGGLQSTDRLGFRGKRALLPQRADADLLDVPRAGSGAQLPLHLAAKFLQPLTEFDHSVSGC